MSEQSAESNKSSEKPQEEILTSLRTKFEITKLENEEKKLLLEIREMKRHPIRKLNWTQFLITLTLAGLTAWYGLTSGIFDSRYERLTAEKSKLESDKSKLVLDIAQFNNQRDTSKIQLVKAQDSLFRFRDSLAKLTGKNTQLITELIQLGKAKRIDFDDLAKRDSAYASLLEENQKLKRRLFDTNEEMSSMQRKFTSQIRSDQMVHQTLGIKYIAAQNKLLQMGITGY
jgi:hypothetical protein